LAGPHQILFEGTHPVTVEAGEVLGSLDPFAIAEPKDALDARRAGTAETLVIFPAVVDGDGFGDAVVIDVLQILVHSGRNHIHDPGSANALGLDPAARDAVPAVAGPEHHVQVP